MTMLNAIPRGAMNRTTVRRVVDILLTRIGRLINCWTAAVIARHERQAGLSALRQLSDRELRDIGLYRCDIGEDLAEAAKFRIRMQQTERS